VSYAKTDKPIQMPFKVWTQGSMYRWGAHWRNLANTIEPPMCGGDAAFLSNYFDHLLSNSDKMQLTGECQISNIASSDDDFYVVFTESQMLIGGMQVRS